MKSRQFLASAALATSFIVLAPATSAHAAGKADIAKSVLRTQGITLATAHESGVNDGATAKKNIQDTARGKKAKRSNYGNAPGGSVALNKTMLNSMLKLRTSKRFTFKVTEVAGGSHSVGSKHYSGRAFDVGTVNGSRVSPGGSGYTKAKKFMRACKTYGAVLVLGPGDAGHSTHVHCQW
ncbi:hypothetical protein AB0I16_21270 [Streptomyces sp. NPDC050703]|uniref:hypothetical protein n=1 Tax=Streptomyces sp. NPDC050703 TaxID=3157218 RepID=UPI003438D3AB